MWQWMSVSHSGLSWLSYTGKETLHGGALDRREFVIEIAVGVSALDNLQ